MLSIIPSDFFLPLRDVKLGRLVKSVEHPLLNYHDPPYSPPPETKPNVRSQYTRESQGEKRADFTSKLTSLMSYGFSKQANTKVKVETNEVKTYTLDNAAAWFTKATGDEDTRKWIERSVGGNGIHFVVGFHKVTNAYIAYESIKGQQLSGEANLPLGLSLTAVGDIAPSGCFLDSAAAGHYGSLDGAKTGFFMQGEQVCALQYCKISYRWLHTKSIDNLKLSEVPRWTAQHSWRTASFDEVEEISNVIEVQIHQLEDLEGNWDVEEGGEGEVFMIQSVEGSDN